MSITIIEQQIGRFLASEVPEVLAIKGGWGVGKTYAWNAYLHAAKNQRRIALSDYSYVSLFGINSLSELKNSIFENMMSRQHIGRRPSVESFRANMNRLLRTTGKKKFALFAVEKAAELTDAPFESLAFLSLEKTLICLDDFERKGKGMETQDILGLITILKEQKKCKVVLILNDESLGGDSHIEYNRLREKVIDSELRFAPSAKDCVAISLRNDLLGKILGPAVMQLQINNIRIIKKTEALASLLVPVLKNVDPQVLERAVRILALLAWCYYSRSAEAPDYAFIMNRTASFASLDSEENLTTQQQQWNAILRGYDNFCLDDFGRQIGRLVENGYLDEEPMKEQAIIYDEQIRAARSEKSFQEAWQTFYRSFDDNATDVITCLSESFRDNARHISPVNLDGSVRLLRYLGKDKLASRIIDLYIEKRKGETKLFAIASAVETEEIRDPEVIEKFRQVQHALREKLTVLQLCERLHEEGDHSDEEHQLAQASVTDFILLFKGLNGDQLSRHIDACLRYGRLGGISDSQRLIVEKATAALQQIGRESRLNASRVRRFGVSI
ncbi:P-loop NTPase fold protein [Pelovirga terrestris]|uniref:KAP NTPase domain-containing protein n=1 Tax=Pelovirga terrestris TaxID=2771352 RepID=A0A8J6QYJ1_9BACT|nr:P-loop NTPase fold protein [Pelovirga terrestris]MBD1400722.1 hypothetical protein [Pelovirga terrestris]